MYHIDRSLINEKVALKTYQTIQQDMEIQRNLLEQGFFLF